MDHATLGTRRVELSDGGWADVRTFTTVGDVRWQRQRAHERGYEDTTLETLDSIQRFVTAWSYGEVTEAVLDSLPSPDALALLNAINEPRPNPSSLSSNGGGREKAPRRQNGSSE